MADILQPATQRMQHRIFGVGCTLVGVDESGLPQIWKIDPSAFVCGYKALSIGHKEQECMNMLEKEVKQSMSDEWDTKELMAKVTMILQSSLGLEFKAIDIEVGYINVTEPTKVKMLNNGEIEEMLNLIADRDWGDEGGKLEIK